MRMGLLFHLLGLILFSVPSRPTCPLSRVDPRFGSAPALAPGREDGSLHLVCGPPDWGALLHCGGLLALTGGLTHQTLESFPLLGWFLS